MKRIPLCAAVLLLFSLLACKNKPAASSDKRPASASDTLSDDALMDTVQRRTFQYFWEGGEPYSGMARERYHIDNVYPAGGPEVVTSGGSGFGIMAILSGIDRGYVSRQEGLERMDKIVTFLEKADRFHGAYPHWWNGETGKVLPFGSKDNGGDLVETAFLMQGLLAVHQYYVNGTSDEKELAARIDKLWREVDWNFYRQNGQNVLYWHWSPTDGWAMNFPVHGYNECMIMYILAAASPTHGIPATVYNEGWAQNGQIVSPHTVEGIKLHLRYQGTEAGPLFWAQYSFLGMNPNGLQDKYCPSYFNEMRNLTLVNRAYCIRNPKHYTGFGPDCWGLTASYSVNGHAAHAPHAAVVVDRDTVRAGIVGVGCRGGLPVHQQGEHHVGCDAQTDENGHRRQQLGAAALRRRSAVDLIWHGSILLVLARRRRTAHILYSIPQLQRDL